MLVYKTIFKEKEGIYMDNKEELEKIRYVISDLKSELKDIDYDLSHLTSSLEKISSSIKNSSPKGVIMGIFVILALSCSIYERLLSEKADKVIIYNDDNAVIFDINEHVFVEEENNSVIYIDEDSGISANDIAVSLVGEDGTVYYYNSETKEKVLINQK